MDGATYGSYSVTATPLMVSWISSYAAGLASPDTLLAGGDMSAAALLSGTTAAAAAAAAATEVVFSPTTNADLLLFPAMNDDHYGEQTASLQENGFLFFEGEWAIVRRACLDVIRRLDSRECKGLQLCRREVPLKALERGGERGVGQFCSVRGLLFP